MRLLNYALIIIAGLVLTSCSEKKQTPFAKDWQVFAQRFYEDGRIVDTGNDGISHSEGQGYGMLFAAVAGDKTRFDELWRWTRVTLQRDDGLFSWRYRPCPEYSAACVDDPNNASDGDVLIAWALYRAAQVWGSQTYRQQAITILNAIEDKLIVTRQGQPLLLPGEAGFMNDDGLQLNLSYWIFPAFSDFYALTNQPVWQQLSEQGQILLKQARWGNWKLPADWVSYKDGELHLQNTLHTDYGYNACRIPLHVVWQKQFDNSLLSSFLNFYDQQAVPATVDVKNGNTADHSWSKGMATVADVVAYRAGKSVRKPQIMLGDEQDYYSASLIMLSQLALMDTESP